MTAVYWRKSRRRLVFGARRRYWYAAAPVVIPFLAVVVGRSW